MFFTISICMVLEIVIAYMQVHYFWPLDDNAVGQFEVMWCQVTNQLGGKITSDTIPVMFGR